MPENPAREAAKTLKLVGLDFQLAPASLVRQEMKCSQSAINQRRQTDFYKEAMEEMKQGWLERMRASPGTNELRKKINYGVGIGVEKLIHILASPRTANRDIVGATRLIAQMDGRFIGSETSDGIPRDDSKTESLAAELMKMVNRKRDSVQ